MRGLVRRAGRPSNKAREEAEGANGAVLRALVDPARRKLLLLLSKTPMPVHALAAHFPVSRPMVSKHLRTLARAGLVEAATVGRERHYRLTEGEAARTALAIAALDERYDEAFRNLRDHLEGEN
ncbi:MAG TPA: metalloregulator ArsR/SmtB family transcription factor [Candidatus Thermoplasmatota archaeon]|nr:metalloregulator ArsR/SmtB family transcription factor [Candidatus Thermoplasmatota archaeon]